MNRLLNFGFSSGQTPANDGANRGIPASWYRSEAMYKLERRAVFSKKWIVVSHQLRFVNPGDFLQFEEAGFNFFLVKDRRGTINGFHNVCRHRAYPVIQRDSGSLNIIACKYHGWSYGLDGKLAKAPRYQGAEELDRDRNSLFPIHVHLDKLGFVWVNLEATSTPSSSWADDFAGVDCQPRLQKFNMTDYHFDHQWEMLGDYNWKTLADNYNECYHCPTGHPGVRAVSDLSKYWVETSAGHIQHFNTDKEDQPGMGIYSTFHFPNASITISPHFFYLMRCIPISASQTMMEYEVYRNNNATDEEFHYIDQFFKQVLREDKDLCNSAQKNLNVGVYTNGPLHSEAEKGPLYFQRLVRKLVMDHRHEEEKVGNEIWPATPAYEATDKLEDELRFCEKLECSSSAEQGPLAW